MKKYLKIFASIIIILIPMYCYCQSYSEKKFNFGYGIGFNTMGLSISSNPGYVATSKSNVGINIHVTGNFYLNQRLDLRILAGFLLNQRTINIRNTDANIEKLINIESNIIEFPISLKYKFSTKKNKTPYSLISLNPRYDLAGDTFNNLFYSITLLRKFNLYPEIGCGMKYQLKNIKLNVEIKYSFGLLNANLRKIDKQYAGSFADDYELYTLGIKNVYSHLIILCFIIE